MLRLLLTLLLLNTLFVALAWPLTSTLPLLAAEALLLFGVFLWWSPTRRPRWRAMVATASGLLYVASALLIGFDYLTRTSLGRPLVVYLDFPLLRSAYDLSMTNLGGLATAMIAVFGTLAIVGTISLIARLLLRLPEVNLPARRGLGALSIALGMGALLLMPTGLMPVSAAALQTLRDQTGRTAETVAGNQSFVEELAALSDTAQPRQLADLSGRDVLLVFIESYGMQALTHPEYADRTQAQLARMQSELSGAGLQSVSARLKAPIEGGQSWLSHGSALSGLWIDNQIDYEAMLDSGIPTLVSDFNATGHDTLAVMPANTREWLPGEQYGFDEVYDATNMGYAGPAMNFFTMPDQYTLSWLHHEQLSTRDSPVFAEVALISSHAPWVPVMPILPWAEIGDGSAYNELGQQQPTPEELFQDQAAVRDHYNRTLEYSLQVVSEFAQQFLADDALLIVLGDHEAPPMVTQSPVSREVPAHFISADASLLASMIDNRSPGTLLDSLESGMIPQMADADAALGAGMDDLRDLMNVWFGGS